MPDTPLQRMHLTHQISQNTREHMLTEYYPPAHQPPLPNERPPGRTGLYYRACMSSYRPKFFCPETTCRRSIKPIYDPDRFEYRISEFQDWSVRPLEKYSLGLAAAYQFERNYQRLLKQGDTELAIFRRLQRKYSDQRWNDGPPLTEEEFEFVKARDPELWWTEFVWRPKVNGGSPCHLVRCPSCRKNAVRVGSNFRIPKKRDEKAWKEIQGMIERGDDMVAKFEFCATTEEHEKMVKRALELRAENKFGAENISVGLAETGIAL
jgi:hypothetical protein